MLSWIELENFKANRYSPIRVEALTVLAGLNSSGKSSVLQALALLRQTYLANNAPHGLSLKGHLIQLGRYRDVHTEGADNDVISLSLVEDDFKYKWSCIGKSDEDVLKFVKTPKQLPKFVNAKHFQYLQADRMVPKTLYPQAPDDARELEFLGTHGEYTVDYLAQPNNGRKLVSKRRLYRKPPYLVSKALVRKVAQTPRLLDQVGGWLQSISPGVRLNAEVIKGTDEVRLQYGVVGRLAIKRGGTLRRPANMGFGVTYSLPIIVACLIAERGSLLLLENPEAHLHPKGQAALGDLIARATNDGVQIIVETHSDHLLNGIRLAVKRGICDANKVALNFFSRASRDDSVRIKSPALLPNGRLTNWPDGFFDQWDKAVDALLDD